METQNLREAVLVKNMLGVNDPEVKSSDYSSDISVDKLDINDEDFRPKVVVVKSLGVKNKKGFMGTYTLNDDVIVSYTSADDKVTYCLKDCVYIENVLSDQPFYISIIQTFELTSANKLMVHVKWFFRHSEIPHNIYKMLILDRKNEKNSGRDLAKGSALASRELFVSEATDTYSVSALRGKCEVTQYQDLKTAKEEETELEKFFYVLGYHPDTKRLATTQGEIRVGSSHQARLPECKPLLRPRDMPEKTEDYEEVRWRPESVLDADLMMYLRAARSVAAFAGMCDGGSTEEGCQAASMDETTINAMDTLHEFTYDTGSALQAIIKCPVPRSIDKNWTDDEVKRFVKGLRQFGKNFFKICKELLAHKETWELVEFYYFWKKTQNASNFRSHRRHRRQAGLKKQNTRSQRPASSEFLDVTSASDLSDLDSVSDDSDSRDLTGYTCRRCFTTTSKDWHHGGKDKSLLCTDCRIFFKKYGEDRPIVSVGEPPSFLFRPVKEEEGCEGLDGRPRQIQELSGHRLKNERRSTSSPDLIDSPLQSSENSLKAENGRKSPSSGSTCSNSSMDRGDKTSAAEDLGSKRHSDDHTNELGVKKPREAPDWESCSDSSSVSGQDENGNDGDIENNQDDLSSSAPSSIPGTPPPTNISIDEKPNDLLLDNIKIEQDIHGMAPNPDPNVTLTNPQVVIKQEPIDHVEPASITIVANSHVNNAVNNTVNTVSGGPSSRQNSPFQTYNNNTPTAPLPNPPPLHPVHMANNLPGYYYPPYSTNPVMAPHLGMPNLPTYPPQQHPPFLPPQVMTLPQKQSPSPGSEPRISPAPVGSISESRLSPHPTTFHPLHPSLLRPSVLPHVTSSIVHRPTPSPHRASLTPHRTSPALHRTSPTPHRASPIPHRVVSPVPHRATGSSSPLPALHQSSPIQHLPHPQPSLLPPTIHNPALPPPPPLQPVTPKREYTEDDLKCNETDLNIKPEPQTTGYDGDEHTSDNEQRGTPSPGPVPTSCNEELLMTKNAIFIKLLDRGYNSCSRCDVVFKPHPDSKLAKKREERQRKSSSRLSSPASSVSVKEEKSARMSHDEKPSHHPSADAHITSGFTPSHGIPYSERVTPRPFPGHDTPALRQLSEYARPHVLGHDMGRPLPYGLGGPLPSHLDPMAHYRMAAMYPPGSRERLEFELERDKRERDAREREMRERELREMELREKLMCEMDMKPPGFDRLMMPHGVNPLDPQFMEIQRRYYQAAMANSNPLMQGINPHLPGVYPPSSIASDLLARDRERLERLGIPTSGLDPNLPPTPEMAERLQQTEQRLAMTDPVMRLQMNNISRAQSHMHTHAHSHTHLHLHQQQELAAGLRAQALNAQAHSMHQLGNHGGHPLIMPHGPGDPMTSGLQPPNLPQFMHGREREMMHPDLLRNPYAAETTLAHHLSLQAAHHEAWQRQLAMERERFGSLH